MTHGPIFLLFQLCNSFRSFICYYCPFVHLTYVNSNVTDAQRPVKENGRLPYVGVGGGPTPLAKLQDLLNGALSPYRGIRLPNAVQDFCQ